LPPGSPHRQLARGICSKKAIQDIPGSAELGILTSADNQVRYGAVVIGRNEGDRLKRCLLSLSDAALVVYVDSGSTDGSAQWARDQGADVVEFDLSAPFTAARARNSGYRRQCAIKPELEFIQFVDGDCELASGWPEAAISFLDKHEQVGAVFGRLRERYPERSIYNRLCDMEWNVPLGESRACGGIALMRTKSLQSVGGFREELIAGEEPELCVRLRAKGWRIWHINHDMASHDAGMTHFRQWWRRRVRAGFAFAQGAHLHGASPERHWVWESRRALIWGIGLPAACLATSVLFSPVGFISWMIYPLQIVRLSLRSPGALTDRLIRAVFETLGRFPEAEGQLKFMFDKIAGRQRGLIEYK
jgi:GT2 family glycosyltransferase